MKRMTRNVGVSDSFPGVPLRISDSRVMESGGKFLLYQLLQVFKIESLSHGIQSGMELKWGKEGILTDDCVRIEFIVSGIAVTYQTADQGGIILRQFNTFG